MLLTNRCCCVSIVINQISDNLVLYYKTSRTSSSVFFILIKAHCWMLFCWIQGALPSKVLNLNLKPKMMTCFVVHAAAFSLFSVGWDSACRKLLSHRGTSVWSPRQELLSHVFLSPFLFLKVSRESQKEVLLYGSETELCLSSEARRQAREGCIYSASAPDAQPPGRTWATEKENRCLRAASLRAALQLFEEGSEMVWVMCVCVSVCVYMLECVTCWPARVALKATWLQILPAIVCLPKCCWQGDYSKYKTLHGSEKHPAKLPIRVHVCMNLPAETSVWVCLSFNTSYVNVYPIILDPTEPFLFTWMQMYIVKLQMHNKFTFPANQTESKSASEPGGCKDVHS